VGIPTLTCKIMRLEFPETFNYQPIEVSALTYNDLFAAVRSRYPDYNRQIYEAWRNGDDFELLIFMESTEEWEPITFNQLENGYKFEEITQMKLDMYPVGSGTKGLIGVGLLALGLSGVGLLGISATTLALAGGSLLFSSIFKHPKSNTDKNNEKRSVNFGGVVNTTGGGVLAPLVFGECSVGSIVASASIVPYDSSV
jgi:hypothetical protein